MRETKFVFSFKLFFFECKRKPTTKKTLLLSHTDFSLFVKKNCNAKVVDFNFYQNNELTIKIGMITYFNPGKILYSKLGQLPVDEIHI